MEQLIKQAAYLPYGITGKRILITGGTTGIGRATALLLAANGAQVMIVGRHIQELKDTLAYFAEQGLTSQVHGITADLSSQDGVSHTFESADRLLGGVDILVNNAALAYQGVMEGDYKDWQYIVNTNLLGYLACSHEAADRMKTAGEGHIVLVGSMSAEVREAGSSVYVATKAGIEGFAVALRKELNPQGIKVTLIEPGAVGTDMQPVSPEDQRTKEEKQEMLKAEDIAVCILYTLCQPKRCDVVTVQIRPHLQLI